MEVSKDLKIEIRPIPNRQGIRQFSPDLELHSTQFHVIAPFVDPQTLRYKTGLSKEDKAFLEEKGFTSLYETGDVYRRGEPHPFWESEDIKIKLQNNPMFLFPGKNILDFIKWKYLLVSDFVYSSEEEMMTGMKPSATHYIYNEEKEIEVKASKIKKRDSLIKKLSSLSGKKKRNLVLIINNENVDSKSDDYIDVELAKIAEDDNRRNELEDLLDNKAGDLELTALVRKAIHKNILRKTKQGIFFFDTNLGYGEEDVKDVLSKDENQEILLSIKDQI